MILLFICPSWSNKIWKYPCFSEKCVLKGGNLNDMTYNNGLCDEKNNIYECNFDGGDCCLPVTHHVNCDKEGCHCHLMGMNAPSIESKPKFFCSHSYIYFLLLAKTINLSPISNYYIQNSTSIFWSAKSFQWQLLNELCTCSTIILEIVVMV